MERLPEIDDHGRLVAASPDRAWRALVAVLAGTFREVPRPLAAAWDLGHRTRSDDWDHPGIGSTIPGFAVAEIDPPRLLTLRGRHRFSRYEFRFTVDDAEPGRVELHARTSAAFPGLHGRIVPGAGDRNRRACPRRPPTAGERRPARRAASTDAHRLGHVMDPARSTTGRGR